MAGKENVPLETKPSKKPRLSLSLQRKSKRFSSSTAQEHAEMSKQKVPKNTEKTSKWAMTNMTEWLNDYNTRNTDAKCPDEFLTPSCLKENLCKWLCVFVNETRAKTEPHIHPKRSNAGQAQQPYIPPVPLSLPYYNYYPFSTVPPLYPPVSEAEGPAYQ